MKPPRSKFYRYMSWLILGIALLGFGPSFILRPFIEQPANQPPLDAWVFVHATIGFLWVFIFIAQTTLVQTNRVHLHKKLGWTAVGLATMLVVSIIIAALNRPYRLLEAGWARDQLAEGALDLATVVVLDIGGAFYFGSLFLMGILTRNDIIKHRAFMLYAGITVVFQAFVRIGENFFGTELGLVAGAIIALIVILLPLMYEFFKFRKPKKITIGIFAYLILAQITFQVVGQLPGVIDFVWEVVDSLNQ